MTRVASITADGDWRFGRGRAQYLTRSRAIRQNVVTRLRLFADDWFLNLSAGIDWIALLGTRDTRTQIESEIERIVRETRGVAKIKELKIEVSRTRRNAEIQLRYTDVFGEDFSLTTEVEA